MSFQVREGGGFGGFLIASTYASACLRVDAEAVVGGLEDARV